MDGNTKTELCGCACAQQLVAVTERLDKLEALFKDKGSTDIKPATSLEGQARKTSSGKGSPGSSETAEVPEGARSRADTPNRSSSPIMPISGVDS